mmetsp:Transcript_42743/g.135808  ORF Transcript_42743/g.135808 Transcript_42743/m.135808 type:complete len:214 (-) Transcript_42743:1423-2064(-)
MRPALGARRLQEHRAMEKGPSKRLGAAREAAGERGLELGGPRLCGVRAARSHGLPRLLHPARAQLHDEGHLAERSHLASAVGAVHCPRHGLQQVLREVGPRASPGAAAQRLAETLHGHAAGSDHGELELLPPSGLQAVGVRPRALRGAAAPQARLLPDADDGEDLAARRSCPGRRCSSPRQWQVRGRVELHAPDAGEPRRRAAGREAGRDAHP